MGEFNSDGHYIYYCGQESLGINGVAIIVNKRVCIAVFGCNLKNERMISVGFQDKPFNITGIQTYALTSNAEEAEVEWFYEDLQGILELTQKWCPFHYRGMEEKRRKSRDNWNNRKTWPWSTKWSRAKANRVLLREGTGHSKHLLPTTQGKTLVFRWSILKSDWLYSLQPKMEKLYTISKSKTRNWMWLRSWNPYCQIQTEIEESSKTTRPLRCYLN